MPSASQIKSVVKLKGKLKSVKQIRKEPVKENTLGIKNDCFLLLIKEVFNLGLLLFIVNKGSV